MLDLKFFMFRHTDEIEKLQKMKADFDQQLVDMLQQVKGLIAAITQLVEGRCPSCCGHGGHLRGGRWSTIFLAGTTAKGSTSH